MKKLTLIIDATDMMKIYKVAHKFICFLDVCTSSFKGCKEVSFTVRQEDVCALEKELAFEGVV